MRKHGLILLIVFFAAGALWIWAEETITRPEATSPQGLKVTQFKLRGDFVLKGRFLVQFRLTNMTDQNITFHPQYGVFVGARWGDQNRDFGHKDKGRTIAPGGSVPMKASATFDKSGAWTFWPAYNIGGNWGPFKWNAIIVNIEEQETPR